MPGFQPMRQISNLWRNNSIVQWGTGVQSPNDLIAVPSCLNPGNADIAREFYDGRITFGGELHESSGNSPFEITSASPQWIAEIHGFCWLRHLNQANSPIARSNAQTLVRDWIDTNCDEKSGIAWTIEVIANRITSWLAHAPLIIEDVDQEFYTRFLQSIASQTRFLLLSINAGPAGMPRLLARAAIASSSLCLHGQNEVSQKRQISQSAIALGQELTKQFLADGCHISRNPDAGLAAVAVLLPLHQLYVHRQEEPPAQLTTALDRILPMLEFFTHPNGSIAHFNGGGRLDQNLLTAVLSAGGHLGKPPENAALSGYQRMRADVTGLIIDTGSSPAKEHSMSAHASCLSFEMSSGADIIIANCGAPVLRDFELAQAARSTAAHSTATINDTSSCQFRKSFVAQSGDVALTSPPILKGVENVKVERSISEAGEMVVASHSGYAKLFGIVHERTIILSADGNTINGMDKFIGAPKNQNTDLVTLRFHLHPRISVKLASNGISVELSASKGDCWKFTCVDTQIEIGQSIYFQPETSQTKQIILSATLASTAEIRWVLEKLSGSQSFKKQDTSSSRASEDLLDIMP